MVIIGMDQLRDVEATFYVYECLSVETGDSFSEWSCENPSNAAYALGGMN